MRITVVSDIHGNLTAFEAVLADLGQTSPDLVLHGGSMPAEIVDRVRALGWEGVVGNTDEMLWMPESLDEFARNVPKLAPLVATIRQMIPPTLEKLGDERLAWLSTRPSSRPNVTGNTCPGERTENNAPEADRHTKNHFPFAGIE